MAILGVPILLIIKQPDFGTGMAFIVVCRLMLITAGLDKNT